MKLHTKPESAAVPPTSVPVATAADSSGSARDVGLRRGIIHTEISRPIAMALTVLFLLGIYAVPVSQIALEKVRGEESLLLPLFRHAPTRERFQQFEADLEQTSYAKDYVQPRFQELLTRFGRVGNKKAVVGRGGWLYYVPGLRYVAGPGFLDPAQIRGRERAAEDAGDARMHADPRPAIFAFHNALAQRHIALIVVPVPDKAMLQPIELHGRGDRTRPLGVVHNLDFERFAVELNAHGVALFDPAPAQLAPGEAPRFLVQDSHWTPTWMEAVAKDLAAFVNRTVALPHIEPRPSFSRVTKQVERVGDIVDMLKLPEGQTVFSPLRTTIHVVNDATGSEWEPDPKGDVLLLGDSLTNIFTMEFMGWGIAAGFAPQLAYALDRGLDVIAQNDSGAFATRQALALALQADPQRLEGKRVVIWEFASRELAVGDWKPVAWESNSEKGVP